MAAISSTARLAGAVYLLMAVLNVLSMFYFGPAFVVSGDAAATARNILDREFAYRLGLLVGLVAQILFLLLAGTLYQLFKDVDQRKAMLMLLLVSAGIVVTLVNLVNGFAPLILLSGANFLSVFTKPQLEALAYGFLRLKSSGTLVALPFWGLWLFPFGILVIKSGFVPKILGVLLIAAGFAYPLWSFTSIALPAYARVVSQIVMPLEFGELPIIFWLLVKGATASQSRA
jgi:uncharacterized protein DUF4386